jgi:hypothetical protein
MIPGRARAIAAAVPCSPHGPVRSTPSVTHPVVVHRIHRSSAALMAAADQQATPRQDGGLGSQHTMMSGGLARISAGRACGI